MNTKYYYTLCVNCVEENRVGRFQRQDGSPNRLRAVAWVLDGEPESPMTVCLDHEDERCA